MPILPFYLRVLSQYMEKVLARYLATLSFINNRFYDIQIV